MLTLKMKLRKRNLKRKFNIRTSFKIFTCLDRKSMRMDLLKPIHTIFETHVRYNICLKHLCCVVYLPMIHSFSTPFITLFTIIFMKCSVCLYSRFYLFSLFHIFRVSFSSTCYLLKHLNTVRAIVRTNICKCLFSLYV